MLVITLDGKGLEKLQRDLEAFAKRGVPYAARSALNGAAFAARHEWTKNQLPKAMTLRNTFTARSIRVDKATGTSVQTMQSVTGSVVGYMGLQEDGGDTAKKGKHGVPIPTTSAAGQAMRATKRTKLVQKKNWLSAIQLAASIKVTQTGRRGRSQRNAILIARATKAGGGVVYLDLGKRKGLFRITGRKRGISVRMLWDLSRPTVHTKASHTLASTLQAIGPQLTAIQRDAIIEQLERTVLHQRGKLLKTLGAE